jgi:hypothetical protein
VRTYSPSASMTTASLAIDFDGNCTDEAATNVAGATFVSGHSAALLAYSTPQNSCHAPPSSAWNLLAPGSGTTAADSNLIASISRGATLRTCNTGPITCRTFSPRNSTASNQSLTVTVS